MTAAQREQNSRWTTYNGLHSPARQIGDVVKSADKRLLRRARRAVINCESSKLLKSRVRQHSLCPALLAARNIVKLIFEPIHDSPRIGRTNRAELEDRSSRHCGLRIQPEAFPPRQGTGSGHSRRCGTHLRWASKRVRRLAEELQRTVHPSADNFCVALSL